MLIISKKKLDAVFEIVENAYPEEGCGAMLGRIDGEKRIVEEIRELQNSSSVDRKIRYEISPADLFSIIKNERETGQKILGFFHSHPYHPPIPSSTDREFSWPDYSSLIVSVNDSKAHQWITWRLRDESAQLEIEDVSVLEGEAE
jgi:proteasome lid subunit RPN8/RPN11